MIGEGVLDSGVLGATGFSVANVDRRQNVEPPGVGDCSGLGCGMRYGVEDMARVVALSLIMHAL